MAEPIVSVVIPTYNRAYCIERTIESVLAQTHQSLDIVVVDDGSSDGTRDLFESAHFDDRVTYVYQENQGVSAARNRGLRLVRGDYIAFLDSDDIWKRWKLEVQLACLEALPLAGMVWTNMEAVDPDGRVVDARHLRTMYSTYDRFTDDELFEASYPLKEIVPQMATVVGEGTLYFGDIFSPMAIGNLVHTSTVLLRRERLEKVGGFNTDLRIAGEDYEFHLRTCREGPVALVDIAAIEYQIGREDQLTRPSYVIHLAENYLRTITTVVEKDRARISLPSAMLDSALAEAYAWIGQCRLDMGETGEARRRFFQSLRINPWQMRTSQLLLLTCLPGWLQQSVMGVYRRVVSQNGRARSREPARPHGPVKGQ